MDPVGPWSAYASYNRLAGVQAGTTTGDLHHHLAATGTSAPATTSAQLLPGGFLSPPAVGYDTVFTPLFHHAGAKATPHYVTQHRQALAQAQAAASKQSDGDYHQAQAQAFFEQNPAWQQNSPFGILPHESVVATTNFNAHFAAQSINHLNSLAAKNASIRPQSPQVTTAKTFFQDSSVNNKSYATTNAQNLQQSCIVTSSNASGNPSSKEYRVPQAPVRAVFTSSPNAKAFAAPGAKQTPSPQIQTKAQTKIYPDLNTQQERQRTSEEQSQQNSPISFSIMDASRLNYTNTANNNSNKRAFQTNYRHYQQGNNAEAEFQRSKEYSNANGPDCSVVVPRRPSPLQAHSQASPLGHAPSPAYPLYNSPMNSLSSPQNASNQPTPPSPLDVSVPRPNLQNNVAYSSVITRTLNPEKTFAERFDRQTQNQSCWDDRRKFNNYNTGNSIEIPSRQIDIPNSRSEAPQRQATNLGISERQQAYFDSTHQPALQDLSSCRGDPMSIVKNLQQQQSCQIQQVEIKQEIKAAVKRRKSNDKQMPINDVTGRIPPPAHTTGANQQSQNGAYFDFDRWNLPPPPSKIFTSQTIQQHQSLMVPHPHSHHPPPPMPYFPPFHLGPHPSEYPPSVELTQLTSYNEQNALQAQYHQQHAQLQQPQEEQPKVVVPNIEEELNFLSESTPHAQQRQMHQQNKMVPQPQIVNAKPPDKSGPGAGFMSSYIKFLQGERDASPPPAVRGGRKQSWQRIKTDVKNESNGVGAQSAPPPPPLPVKRLTQGDPQDDPRYFPLPKERKQNTFDSSDDGISSDDDLFNKKVPPIINSQSKDRGGRKGRPCKPGGPTERKRARQQMKFRKSKHREERGDRSPVDTENVPRRETSKRAAKEKINMSMINDDIDEPNEFADSDSDPAWTPAAKEDADEEVPLKKGKKGRQGNKRKGAKSFLLPPAQVASIPEQDGYTSDAMRKQRASTAKANNKQGNAPTLEDNIAAAVAQQNDSVHSNSNSDDALKPGEFVVIRNELGIEWPAIWRVDGKSLLQKYEPFEQNGLTLYKNISTYTSWTPETKKQYLTVPVKYRSQTLTETIVEFLRNEMLIVDPEFLEKTVKDNERYQDNFEVYIQTLISQALDSNFLHEIFQEQDEYFLSNVKIIDDITASKKHKLSSTLKWPVTVLAAVATWPCYNVIRDFANNDSLPTNCAACGSNGVAVRVLMYGQPYNITTLEGCQPDPRAINEKDIIMCRICANRVELFNKITHQKYLMYIECAKRVAEKRTTEPHKDTTCILNELLADERWLNQLFYQVRNSWAEVDSIEHSLLQKQLKSQ